MVGDDLDLCRSSKTCRSDASWRIFSVIRHACLDRIDTRAILNTRIISVPGIPLIRRGPYRMIRHPNYVVVILEIAVLPVVFGLWQLALVFSVLNVLLLGHRIKIEDAAIKPRRDHALSGR